MNPEQQRHLEILELRLSNERVRLSQAKGGEKEIRQVWVNQMTRELDGEYSRLGLQQDEQSGDQSDEDLLAELGL